MSTSTPDYAKELFEWGQDVRRLHEEPEELLYAIVNELERLGLQPGLGSVAIRTPHPQLDMLVMRWRPLKTDEVPTKGTNAIRRQHTRSSENPIALLFHLKGRCETIRTSSTTSQGLPLKLKISF